MAPRLLRNSRSRCVCRERCGRRGCRRNDLVTIGPETRGYSPSHTLLASGGFTYGFLAAFVPARGCGRLGASGDVTELSAPGRRGDRDRPRLAGGCAPDGRRTDGELRGHRGRGAGPARADGRWPGGDPCRRVRGV